eukprot:scaffold28541_cov27-Prasinocladus_malaysianus.AAC.1
MIYFCGWHVSPNLRFKSVAFAIGNTKRVAIRTVNQTCNRECGSMAVKRKPRGTIWVVACIAALWLAYTHH